MLCILPLMVILVSAENYGCDGIIGSMAAVDKCGICGGNNSTCELMKGIYTNMNLTSGYNLITELPKGAYNITITQMQETRNYLALRKKDGSSILNGEWVFEQPGVYEAAGTVFFYKRNKVKHEIEEITSVHPLTEPVELWIVSFEVNRGVKYQYFFPPIERHIHSHRKDASSYLALQHHARHHHGLKYSNKSDENIYHFSRQSKSAYASDPFYLDGHLDDEMFKKGKSRKKKFTWKHSGTSVCSKPCGGGVQNPIFVCIRENSEIVVPDKRCANIEKPFLPTKRCNTKPCLPEWVPSEWSACSVTCGEGYESREIYCRQEISSMLTVTVSPGACLGTPPPKTQRCYLTPCTMSAWEVGPWTQCSTNCGGIKTRTVVCRTGQCSATNRPINVMKCENTCQDTQSFWIFTEWTNQCSVNCGKGTQIRNVLCHGGGNCNNNTRPENSRPCVSDKHCSGEWYTGPWQQCTGLCDVGEQTRSVLCIALLPSGAVLTSETSCTTQEKPVTHQKCPLPPCKPEWYMSDWSACTKSCDSGVQKRDVLCLDVHHNSSTACTQTQQPGSYHVCNMNPCSVLDQPQVATNDGGNHEYESADHPMEEKKSEKEKDCVDKLPKHNCHMVVQARLCRYLYYHNSCCLSCKSKKY